MKALKSVKPSSASSKRGTHPCRFQFADPGERSDLLFTNAGMNQFKDCFLGLEKRAYTRATTSQKCVRAGGTTTWKTSATPRGTTLLRNAGQLQFRRLFQARRHPLRLGVPHRREMAEPAQGKALGHRLRHRRRGLRHLDQGSRRARERMVRIGDNKGAPYASDNFWAMGDTGPCGPCTEIFFDHGPEIWGGPPVRRKRTATATSRSGTTCSCSSTAPRTASCTRCRRRA